ncbi:MAG: ribonuclease HI family protein [Candidatus Falkowbacteria bacterium]
MTNKITIYSDGGARGNPGPAAIGTVLYDEGGVVVAEISEYIGETTNNQAEYKAIIAGLICAKELGAQTIECFLDSLLVVEQLNHRYKVKHPGLAPLFLEVHNLRHHFKQISFRHIPREKNKAADKLVNLALDRELGC